MVVLTSVILCGADIYVDYEKGNNRNPGTKAAPKAAFGGALQIANPGDTIYILPSAKPIRDTLIVRKKSGLPGKPITVDGMNNIFLGTEPVDLKKWKEIKPGFFSYKTVAGTNISNRYFMVFDGMIRRMGRFNKGAGGASFKQPDQLAPGEWTIVRTTHRGGRNYDTEYIFRLPENCKTPAEAGVEEPIVHRISGVNIAQNCNYITFRNIIVKNFLNDGYNIHINCRNIRFENIAAVDCGDDGISAHENCQIFVKNMVVIGCSTCACHIQESENHHENVYAEKILGRDLYFTQSSYNTFKNVWINGDSANGFYLSVKSGDSQRFKMEHARMINRTPEAIFALSNKGGKLQTEFKDVKISGYKKVEPSFSVTVVKADEIAKEIADARKRLFANFGGQLERAIGK